VARQRVTKEWNGSRILAELRRGEVKGLEAGADHLLEVSQKIVPLDEKVLQDSGTPSVDEDQRRAAVSYDTPYAVIQHEDQTFQHAPGRTAKYLERPMNSERDAILGLIADEVRQVLR
jgi:hypothetical protein